MGNQKTYDTIEERFFILPIFMIYWVDARITDSDTNRITWMHAFLNAFESITDVPCVFFLTEPLYSIYNPEKKQNIKILISSERWYFHETFSITKKYLDLKIDCLFSIDNPIPRLYRKKSVLFLSNLTPILYPNRSKRGMLDRFHTGRKLRNSIKKADAIIVPYIALSRDIIDIFNIQEEKVQVIPPYEQDIHLSYTDAQITKVRIQYHLTNGYFLYDGWWGAHMNLSRMIIAYGEYIKQKQHEHPLELVILWREKEDYKDIRNHISQLGIQKYIKILWSLKEEETNIIYQEASGFLFVPLYYGWNPLLNRVKLSKIPIVHSSLDILQEIVGETPYHFICAANKERGITESIVNCDTYIHTNIHSKNNQLIASQKDNISIIKSICNLLWETCKTQEVQ